MTLAVRMSPFGDNMPAPARLHAILRASSCTNGHDRLLNWWENLCPPDIHIGGSGASGEGAAFVWADAEPTDEQLGTLRDLIRRVPAANTSAWGECSVARSWTAPADWLRFAPVEGAGDVEVHVAAPGFTKALNEARDHDETAWRELAVLRHYRRVDNPVASGHGEMLTFTFPDGVVVDGAECGMATARLRSATLARVPDPLPPEISGHGANGRPHVAYVPLLEAGSRRSSGERAGVGVVFPRDAGDWSKKVGAALTGGDRSPWIPVGPVKLDLHPSAADSRRCVLPEQWSGPARVWTTVTPMVLDRFSKNTGEEGVVERSCVQLGLPRPSRVEVSRKPLIGGAADLSRGRLPRRDNRPYTHARVEFPVPVLGPVSLGAQRHVGMGLCLSEAEDAIQD